MSARRVVITLLLLLCALASAQAQDIIIDPTGPLPHKVACTNIATNSQGSAGVPVVVDATAGGITVLAASSTRCGGVILNESSGADMRCRWDANPTSTVGFLVPVGTSVRFGFEGQQALKCIRTGGTSATVSTWEVGL